MKIAQRGTAVQMSLLTGSGDRVRMRGTGRRSRRFWRRTCGLRRPTWFEETYLASHDAWCGKETYLASHDARFAEETYEASHEARLQDFKGSCLRRRGEPPSFAAHVPPQSIQILCTAEPRNRLIYM